MGCVLRTCESTRAHAKTTLLPPRGGSEAVASRRCCVRKQRYISNNIARSLAKRRAHLVVAALRSAIRASVIRKSPPAILLRLRTDDWQAPPLVTLRQRYPPRDNSRLVLLRNFPPPLSTDGEPSVRSPRVKNSRFLVPLI